MAIAKKIAYSIPTESTGVTAIDAVELTVVDPAVVPDVSGDKYAYAVLCSNSNFSDTTADYETIKVTADSTGVLTIERGIEGAAREWPDGSAIRFSGTYSGYQDLVTHVNNTTDPHGAVSAATASKLMVRDADGRARVADPDNAADIATKSFVETLAGRIVQVVTATSTTSDSTQSTSFVDTSLTCAITPKYDNSLLLVITSAHGDVRHQESGDAKKGRSATYALYNSTNTAYLQGAESVVYGRNLDAVSDKTTHSFYNVFLMGQYTVNSTAARTFVLRHSVPTAELISRIRGGTSTALMTILEVKV